MVIPQVSKGHLDLSSERIKNLRPITLQGEWSFYWQQLLDPEQVAQATQHEWVQLPHIWKKDTTPSTEGYATYRMTIALHPEDIGSLKALYVHGIASAYKLWVNGKLLLENGTVAADRSMKAKHYSRVAAFQPEQQQIEIVIQVSNFVQRKGGIWGNIEFGEAETVALKREKSMALQTFVASGLFLMGLYHLALGWFRKGDKVAFYTAICSLLYSVRTVLLGENVLVRFIPEVDWEWTVKFEYLIPYMTVPLFMLFVRELYPKESYRWVSRLSLGLGLAFSAVVLVFPARVFTYTLFTYEFIIVVSLSYIVGVFVLAAYRRREYARLQCMVIILMMFGAINDILYHSHWIQSIDFSPLSIYLYLFAQTLIIAYRYSQLQYKVERLSYELRNWNTNLESRIQERTYALEASHSELSTAYDQLHRLEESRRSLIANISHELKTPMTTIQGYLKAMIDGMIPMGDDKPIKMVYGKVLFVNRLVQDLFELSKLESHQIKFHYEPIPAKQFLETVYHQFELDIRGRGFHFELKQDASLLDSNGLTVVIDSDRMLQVMTNLIYNAVKFTPSGGSILVYGTKTDRGELLIQVKDTGAGIEEHSLPHVFERFYKASRHKSMNKDGTGLGLSIVKEIITQHGGTIGVTSRLLEGSTFYFTLPANEGTEE